jgi:hypothetical protein
MARDEKRSRVTGDGRLKQEKMEKEGNESLFIYASSIALCDVRTAADAAPQYQAYSKAYRLHAGGYQLAMPWLCQP